MRAAVDKIIDRLTIAMGNDGEIIARFKKVGCHAVAHQANANEADFHVWFAHPSALAQLQLAAKTRRSLFTAKP